MTSKLNKGARMAGLVLALSWTVLAGASNPADNAHKRGHWIVGTWYLALDTVPFGLPPGFPLNGLAIFNSDGTFQFQDGGDFGQATFLNTQHTTQFGAWRRAVRRGAVGAALFFEADLPTGEVLRWLKTDIKLHRTRDRDVVTGIVNVSRLDCPNMLPLPTPLTCPDPIKSAGDFVVVPPTEVPITLRRLKPRR